MASMEILIDEFIAEYTLDVEIKDPLCDLFSKCMEALTKHLMKEQIPQATPAKSKSQKVLKADKIDDPTTCENYEELNNCSTGVLNQFCGDNGLKKGGNKKELKDRVWRHLQGSGSDDDKSPRNKPKTTKKENEKHACSGCNASGAPCSVAGTEPKHGVYWCWRHINNADEFFNKKEEDTSTKQVVEKPTKKKSTKKIVELEEE
jgi:hypothetical protein